MCQLAHDVSPVAGGAGNERSDVFRACRPPLEKIYCIL